MSDLPFHRFLPGRSESSRDLIINIAYPPEMHKAAGRIPIVWRSYAAVNYKTAVFCPILNHFFRSFAIMYSVTPGRYRFGISPSC